MMGRAHLLREGVKVECLTTNYKQHNMQHFKKFGTWIRSEMSPMPDADLPTIREYLLLSLTITLFIPTVMIAFHIDAQTANKWNLVLVFIIIDYVLFEIIKHRKVARGLGTWMRGLLLLNIAMFAPMVYVMTAWNGQDSKPIYEILLWLGLPIWAAVFIPGFIGMLLAYNFLVSMLWTE